MRKSVLHPILGNTLRLFEGNYAWDQNVSYMFIKNIKKEQRRVSCYRLFFKIIAGLDTVLKFSGSGLSLPLFFYKLEGTCIYVQMYTYILEKGMTTQSSILAWRIPWAGESGGIQSIESHKSDMAEAN